MSSPEIEAAVRPVVEALERLGIDYRVGGSVASTVLGMPRSTIVADIACPMTLSHVDPFVDELSATCYVDRDRVRDSVRRRSSFNVIHLETMLKVDVFVCKPRAYELETFNRVADRRLGDSVASRTYAFVTAEDVILLELEWYRCGGEVSERQWTDALGVVKVQGTGLDRPYLERWAEELGVAVLLRRLLVEGGLEEYPRSHPSVPDRPSRGGGAQITSYECVCDS